MKDHKNFSYFDRTDYFKNADEFLAGAHSDPYFWDALHQAKVSDELRHALGLEAEGKSFWESIKSVFKQLWKEAFPDAEVPNDTYLDAVMRVSDVAEHMRGQELGDAAPAPAKRGSADKTLAVGPEGRLVDRAESFGMTVKQYNEYIRQMLKEEETKRAFLKDMMDKRSAARQTEEWKAAEAQTKLQVRGDVSGYPDVVADNYFRTGEFLGTKGIKPLIDPKVLTPEQRAILPKSYLSNRGEHPDVIAGRLGYETGDKLIADLSRMSADRENNKLSPAAQLTRMVVAETSRRMEAKFGDLQKNIVDAAIDNVITGSMIDRISMEMQGLAKLAGKEMLPFERETLQSAANRAFRDREIGSINVQDFLKASGDAAQGAEVVDRQGRAIAPSEAFRAKQDQAKALMEAKLAREHAKTMEKFNKLIRPYTKGADVSGRDPGVTLFIQQIMAKYSLPVGRSAQDLAGALERSTYGTLAQYMDMKNSKALSDIHQDPDIAPTGVPLPISEFVLRDSNKGFKDLTVDEFNLIHGAIAVLDKESKKDWKVEVSGRQEKHETTIDLMTEAIKASMDYEKRDLDVKSASGHVGVLLLNMESIMNRIDMGNPDGIMTQTIIRPIVSAFNESEATRKVFAKKFRDVGDFGDLDKKIENPLFRDGDGELIKMTRGRMLAVLQNWGNAQNRMKLLKGYGDLNEQQVFDWLAKNTTKEDWDRAQRLGDIFHELYGRAETLYGWSPPRIDIDPFMSPYGQMRGWYHKLVPDPELAGDISGKISKLPDENGFNRTAPASAYRKGRTGATYPLLLNFNMVAHTINQMVNDIEMRPAVTQVARIFADSRFTAAFSRYYGREYAKALVPWLRDSAGVRGFTSASMVALQNLSDFVREGLVTSVIGLNPSTPLKHFPTALAMSTYEVGIKGFAQAFTKLWSESPDPKIGMWSFMMHGGEINGVKWNGSVEMQRRFKNWVETLSGSEQELFKRYSMSTKLYTFRDVVQRLGASPVAISDMISAGPTWIASYTKATAEGKEHGEAVFLADRSVRRAHGSTAITNKPALMRMSPFLSWATPFYGFFNTALNRSYELSWMAKLSMQGRKLAGPEAGPGEGRAVTSLADDTKTVTLGKDDYKDLGFSVPEFKSGFHALPMLAGGAFIYLVAAPLIEQAISPLEREKKDSLAWYATKVALVGWSGMIPYFNTVIRSAFEGRAFKSGLGLYDQPVERVVSFARDLIDHKKSFTNRNAGRVIKDFVGVIASMGVAHDQEGKIAEYIWNVEHGKERPPQNTWQLLEGLRFSTAKHHSKDFGQYLKQTFGKGR